MSLIQNAKTRIRAHRTAVTPKPHLLSLLTVALLSACGGSSGGSDDEPAFGAALPESIVGSWQTACFVVTDGLSARNLLEVGTTAFNRSTLLYANTDVCAGQLNYLVSITGTYSLPGESTQTGTAVAQHIDIAITDIEGNSTPSLNAQLALVGSNLDDFLLETIGISDSNDIQPEEIGLTSTTFSLIAVENGVLSIGDNNSNTGDSPETRLTELSTESQVVFTRQ